MIKLVAIDLDGTLLDSNKEISPNTVSVISEIRKRGVTVALSTARPPRTTLPYYDQLGLKGPMINYNGAFVWMPREHKTLMHKPIPCSVAKGIIRWARQRHPEIRVSAEVEDKWYTDFYDGTYRTETAKLVDPDVVGPIDEWLHQPLTKLLLLGKRDWLTKVNEAIKADLPDKLRTVQTDSNLLQIMEASVSKAVALKHLAHLGKFHRHQVMAIGDNANDAGMIQWAGTGVAMANGHVVCLQVADHIAGHHNEDGVANVLREIIIEGRPVQSK